MRTYALFILMLLMPGLVHSQAMLIWQAPPKAAASTDIRMPNGTAIHTSLRGHFILTAADLSGLPTGIPLQTFGFNYARGVPTAAGGSFRIYLQNTTDATNLKSTNWATAIASMTEVYVGPLALPVGGSTALDLLLNRNTFIFSGSALYVAYEYSGQSFSTASANYVANNDLPQSLWMGSSTSTTLPTNLNNSSPFRPQVRFGWPNSHQHNIAIEGLSTKFVDLNALWDDEVSVKVSNRGLYDQSNVAVLLETMGANATSESLPIWYLGAGLTTILTVVRNDLLNEGVQAITASVGPDDSPSDDRMSIDQMVSCERLSIAGTLAPYRGIGFGTGSGILAVRYRAPSMPILVKGIYAEVHGAAAQGTVLTGQLLNAAGAVVATSDPVVVREEFLASHVSFHFAAPVEVAAGADIYAGVMQSPGLDSFPISSVPPASVSPDRVYSFPTGGGNGTNYTNQGTPNIGLLAKGVLTVQVGTDGHAVDNQPVDITATPGYRFYDFQVNGNPVQSGASNILTYLANDLDVVSVTAKRNACAAEIDVEVPVVGSDHIFANGFEVLTRVIH